jgi:hypothetical protein
LKKVFLKLGISSRRALRETLRRESQGTLLAQTVVS